MGPVFIAWCTLIAQTLLTTRCGIILLLLIAYRICGLTCLNRPATMCFTIIALLQLSLGVVMSLTWNRLGTHQPHTQIFATIFTRKQENRNLVPALPAPRLSTLTLSWLTFCCRCFSVRDINRLMVVTNTPPGYPDFAALCVTLFFAFRSARSLTGFRTNILPQVMHTVVRDATWYFGAVFISQFIVMMFQISARVRYQPQHSSGFGSHRHNHRTA